MCHVCWANGQAKMGEIALTLIMKTVHNDLPLPHSSFFNELIHRIAELILSELYQT